MLTAIFEIFNRTYRKIRCFDFIIVSRLITENKMFYETITMYT